MRDGGCRNETERLAAMALELISSTIQHPIRVTIPKTADPKSGSFPQAGGNWWGSRRANQVLARFWIWQLRCISHAALAGTNYFSSGETT